jgi:hypothetical protein
MIELEKHNVDWRALVKQAAAGTLYLLDADRDLTEVCTAVAKDDVPVVKALLESNALRKPTDDEMGMDGDTRLDFVIVAPFVVAQFAAAADGSSAAD